MFCVVFCRYGHSSDQIFAHTLNHLLKINSSKYDDCVEGNKVLYGFQCVLPELLGDVFPLRFFYDFGKLRVPLVEESPPGQVLPPPNPVPISLGFLGRDLRALGSYSGDLEWCWEGGSGRGREHHKVHGNN